MGKYGEGQRTETTKRSCDLCRKRKVRCDGNVQQPCHSCRKAGVECRFQSKPKKSGPPSKKYTDSLENEVQLLRRLLEKERTHRKAAAAASKLSALKTSTQGNAPTATTTCHLGNTDIGSFSDPMSTLSTQEAIPDIFLPPHTIQFQQLCAVTTITSGLCQTLDLIREIPNLTPELAERMITAYLLGPNPDCGLIDKHSFLMQYYYQHPQPLDRHLFYAVCAVGAQFLPRQPDSIDHAAIRKAGYYLRKKAMQVMDLAYKQSSISTLQALVLVSLLAPNSDNGGGCSTYWLILGAAIRMYWGNNQCQDLGLYCDSRQQHLPKNQVELRRRIAHFVYCMDKIAAAASGKPVTMREEDFAVPLPSVYEIEPEASLPLRKRYSNGPVPILLEETERDIREKRPVYTVLLQLIPLARMLGHVLASFYSPTPVLDINIDLVSNFDTALVTWKANIENKPQGHKEILHLLYNSVVLLLYHPLISTSQATSEIDGRGLRVLDFCTTVATNIINWCDASPICGVPCVFDYFILQAATIFLKNCNHRDVNIRSQARSNLARCAQLYERDDILNQCQNAVILNELVKQLSVEDSVVFTQSFDATYPTRTSHLV